MTDFRELGEASAIVRGARATWRQMVHDNPAVFGDILATRPEELRDLFLTEILLWLPGFGESKLEALGRRAVRWTVRVNINVRLGNASTRTRQWVAQEVDLSREFYRPLALEMAA